MRQQERCGGHRKGAEGRNARGCFCGRRTAPWSFSRSDPKRRVQLPRQLDLHVKANWDKIAAEATGMSSSNPDTGRSAFPSCRPRSSFSSSGTSAPARRGRRGGGIKGAASVVLVDSLERYVESFSQARRADRVRGELEGMDSVSRSGAAELIDTRPCSTCSPFRRRGPSGDSGSCRSAGNIHGLGGCAGGRCQLL